MRGSCVWLLVRESADLAGARVSAQEKYSDCLCKTCLSMAVYHTSTLKKVWGIDSGE